MKRVAIFLSVVILTLSVGFAQSVIVALSFTGMDSTNNAYVQLSRIEITNVSQGWSETLTYPDTIAILTIGNGIEEHVQRMSFGLMQNNPNPFTGSTDINLMVADMGTVTVEITDVNGRTVVGKKDYSHLQPGTHQFHVSLSNAGTYVMTACQNGKTSSIKMVCNGTGNANKIEYTGAVRANQHSPQTKNGMKGLICQPFACGDSMTYKGYSERYGMEIEGQMLSQTQSFSEDITLLLDWLNAPNPNDGMPCIGTPTLTDRDNNIYNTVELGEQCWMRENLRTTKYADGVSIPQGVGGSSIAAWSYPHFDASNMNTYGLLYNYAAVMRNESVTNDNPSGVQGICPTGWHVPSDAEWVQLINYLGHQDQYVCDNINTNVAKSLASTTGWSGGSDACAVGNTPANNNATNFSGMPAGYFYPTMSTDESYFGAIAVFWTTTSPSNNDYSSMYGRQLYCNSATVGRGGCPAGCGYSVRCLRD
ncbi:MAG: T9SS type A sorting domain-containing protein [Bacteroidales bacterium]|nr:T9SS type A sorting domain-containing protein [Bacteroidales bacterium]